MNYLSKTFSKSSMLVGISSFFHFYDTPPVVPATNVKMNGKTWRNPCSINTQAKTKRRIPRNPSNANRGKFRVLKGLHTNVFDRKSFFFNKNLPLGREKKTHPVIVKGI